MPTAKPGLLNQLNHNYDGLGANPIRVFDAEANQVPDVVKLTLGEPDFNVPDHIKQAAIASITADESHYGPSNGWPKLRRAATGFLKDRYGLAYDPDHELVVTVGATEALHACLAATLNAGDAVLMPSPTFSLYDQLVRINGATPVYLNTATTGFKLTPAQLAAAIADTPTAKAILLNFPANPTGVTYTRAEVQALAAVCAQTNLVVIADEIYSELTYGFTHTSFAEFLPAQTLVVNGVSKSHAMTGWRIGFVAGPAALMARVALAHAFAVTVASNPAMAGATEALSSEAGRADTIAMKREYLRRRDYVVTAMRALGFTMPTPTGAFYVFAKLPASCGQDDVAFCHALLHQNHLALIAGSGFGPGGEGYVRVSYAASLETLQEAMRRLGDYVHAQA